jgi:DNA-dependent RNA polymerase
MTINNFFKMQNTDNRLNDLWHKLLDVIVTENLRIKAQIKQDELDSKDPDTIFSFKHIYDEDAARFIYNKYENLETSISNLDYGLSENFFTKSFVEKLKLLLKNGSRGKTSAEMRALQAQLSQINSDEYEWKRRVKGHSSDYSDIIELFPKQMKKFSKLMNAYMYPTEAELEVSQRNHVNFFKYKLKALVTGLLHFLATEQNLNLLGMIKLSDEDFDRIIKLYISDKSIFTDLVKVIMKMSTDNLFNTSRRERTNTYLKLKDTSLVVDKSVVYYEARRVLTLNIITAVLCYHEKEVLKSKKDTNYEEICNKIRGILYRKKTEYDTEANKWWSLDFSNCMTTILAFLEQSGIFYDIVNEKQAGALKKTERTKYVLPCKLEELAVKFTELPKVARPGSVQDEDIDEGLKDTLFGVNKISKSGSLKRMLSITQNKPYTINPDFLALLKILYELNTGELHDLLQKKGCCIELPFPFESEVSHVQNQIYEFDGLSRISGLNRIFFDEIDTAFLGAGCSKIDYVDLKRVCGITPFEQAAKDSRELLQSEKYNLLMKRKYANTCITIGEVFARTDVYITNTFCVRLRLYPAQPIVSRTSGPFKHILFEKKELKVNYRGLFNLLNCYYIGANQYSSEFQAYESTLSSKVNLKPLFAFFFENPIDFTVLGDNTLYLSMLHMEILKVWETGCTAVMVEIDQKASSCVLLALAMRNKRLAEQCNIISKQKNCPYTYCMLHFPEFYSKYKDIDFDHDDDALNFLSQSRKLHKYAIMCFAYAQGTRGREEDFVERWFLEKKVKPNASTVKVLKWFAKVYDDFVDFLFPGLISQIKILLQLVELVVRENDQMSIQNLNGERLSWSRFKHKSVTRKAFDPVTRKQISYRVETTFLNEDQKVVSDIQDHKIKFLSYFIHSLDAAIMHHFIVEMKVRFNYTINHLHDCVLIHPNHVDGFYRVVRDLYTSNRLYNAAFDGVFSEAERVLSLDSQPKVAALRKQFEKNCDDFENLLPLCEERHIYQPEQ